ncbi:uncharacterized protein LOC143033880 [Oratosquilla oratoria]|uniref:uncharacterized protein LOC143033880 n=1 Tax=Oratosquilla oratoria TaxID=337810 RepID=UPI003F76F92E
MEENEEAVHGVSKEREKIQTFIFLDIEATGLQYDCPKIMEISLIAVSRNDLLVAAREYFKSRKTKANICENVDKPKENDGLHESIPSQREKRESRIPALPRVLHKYTRLYYPKRFITPLVEELTNLSNYNLEHLPRFAEDSADALKLFVNLPKPVAFVAHNGHKYDFPLLKAEFIQADRPDTCSSVLCVDSYIGFLALDSDNKEVEESSKMVIDSIVPTENPSKRRKCDEDSAQDQTEDINNDTEVDRIASSSSFQTPEKSSTNEILELAAKTPVKKRHLPSIMNTPSPGNKNDHIPVISRPSFPCRKLEYNHSDSKNITSSKKSRCISYKQPDIFERLFNLDYRAHSAEGDAMALLQICCHYGNRFIDWADMHAIPFETVNPMWVKK